MTKFRWFLVVATIVAIALVDRTVFASATIPATPGGPDTATGDSVLPASTAEPLAQPASCADICSATCNSGCDTCNSGCDSCPGWYAYGEYLLLRPRSAGVDYAVPINGNIVAGQVPLQIGPTASVEPQFDSGFMVGIERALCNCSSISLNYTYYGNDTDDGPVTANTPFVLRSMVFNPSSQDAATDFGSATAHEHIHFNLVDLDYHHDFWNNECSKFSYLIGVRYGQLEQQFNANFQSIISADVNTNVEFDGFGLRLGLDGGQNIGRGFFIEAKARANLLGGQFNGTYLQSNTNDPIVANTTWHDERFVTILDSEVDLGWQTCDGHVRASIGYTVSGWLNVVKPSDFISSVQANQYSGTNKVGDTALIFDGLKVALEFAW